MPRTARKNIESNYMHVIVQGINREYIFDDERFIKKYLSILLEKCKESNVYILAYCMMNNHAHMLFFADDTSNISKCMKAVNTKYAMEYNNYHDRVGYVFRNRFLSEPIKNENQLYNCIAYIHYNPVNANMVTRPELYKYSSFNDYKNQTGIVNDEILTLVFGSPLDYLEMFNFIHNCLGEGIDHEQNNWKNVGVNNIDIHDAEQLKMECYRLKN